MPLGHFTNGWFIPPPSIGNSKTDYQTRALIARIGLTANIPKETIYFEVFDNNGKVLTGEKRYTVTFQKTPPFTKPAFWSLSMYDARSSYPIKNPLNRYVVGSDSKNMKFNANGSLTIYLQSENPGKEKEANWLPAPNGPFRLILRSYAPGDAMVESLTNPKAYVPPAIVEVK